MKTTIRREFAKRKHHLARRLKAAREREDAGVPTLSRARVRLEIAGRVRAVGTGGVALAHQVAVHSGLVDAIDERLHLLKFHRPYHESDHVLNIAYNVLCGGRTLEDLELLRNDEAYLDLFGTEATPDPTTAGDFCRRFDAADIDALSDAINEARLRVWSRQGPEFTQQTARIDADGSFVTTSAECKEGVSLSYKGGWGYHPLVVSLANTAEPLFIVNRGGSRPSSEGAAAYLDRAVALCRRAGFTDVLLRGDTDFSQTQHLDRWTDDGVRFVFGYLAANALKTRADGLDADAYRELERRAKRAFVTTDKRRQRPERHKEAVVVAKGYRNIKLKSEDLAEFSYRPVACTRPHRIVVVRKNLSIERGENVLFDDIRYFFYVTNDWSLSAEEVVFEANHRCDQENLIAQLKGGVRALHAPVNTLNANGAYMLMASLAWTLKAWMALWLPVSPRWASRHRTDRERWLRMDFRTFRNAVLAIPAQVITTARQRVLRFLSWRPELLTLFRLADGL